MPSRERPLPPIDRRTFVRGAVGTGLALWLPSWLAACVRPPSGAGTGHALGPDGAAGPGAEAGAHAAGPFRHGVASGDPLADRVILWTRVEPPPAGGDVEVEWTLARDPALREPVTGGKALARAAADHTVHVDATGLAPATTWYYRFRAAGAESPVGRTRTLPVGPVERVRIAFCSCANFPFGFFNAYAAMARRADLDLVLHLGDYIYEYGNGTYGDGTALGRVPEPNRELVSLADYRTRYAQYRRDPDLQELHRQHPVVAVWDDHETANNAWRGGAENHQPETEGPWDARRAAAVQAWHEWLPVRRQPDGPDGMPRIWRAFRLGDLAEIAMLDTRLAGRDRQPADGRAMATIGDPARTLLGLEQEAWLQRQLVQASRDGVRWKLLGQQVMLSPLRARDFAYRNPDQWDGYAAARARLLDLLERERVRDVVVLTGDIHSSWAIDVAHDPFASRRYDAASGRGALAVEWVTPGVSSPGVRDRAEAESRAADIVARHPHMKWVDLWHRGYVTVDLTPERAQADWWHFETVEVRGAPEHFARAFATRSGTSHLEPVAEPAPARTGAPPLAPA